MDESIAKAHHKGQRRILSERKNMFLARAHQRPKTRKAYVKWCINLILRSPACIPLSVMVTGSGKNIEAAVVEVSLDESGRWMITGWAIEGRKFYADNYYIPLDITNHVVERIMQRQGIEDVMEAMRFLAPSLGIAVSLMRHPEESVLVPCNDGAIVMAKHIKLPLPARALVTYVPDHKLRPEQKQKMEAMLRYAKSQIEGITRRYGQGEEG